jgi:hypothetical protein
VPGDSLDAFDGLSAIGNWSLAISDDVGLDGLSFYRFSVTVETADVATPEPTSLALLGMGAVGMAGYWRRRRAA